MVGLPTSSTARSAIGGQPVRLAGAQARVADDVLHHDDRIVHEDADGEDQREERDAVQRVAVEVEHEQRQRQRDRNRDEHDRRLAPAEHEPDERRHREHGEQHVPQQLVALLGGGLAVVAGDGEMHVGRARACPSACRASASTWCATSMALVPLRLATAIVTAGCAPAVARLEGDVRRGLGVAVHAPRPRRARARDGRSRR